MNQKTRRANPSTTEFAAAVSHHQAGRLEQAERGYRKVLATTPSDVAALSNLGLIAFHRRRFEEARQRFAAVAALAPDQANAYINLGGACRELGRVDEAARHLRRALALRPNDAIAHTTLGLVLEAQNDAVAAATHLQAAVAIDPGATQARYHLAALLMRAGDPAGAAEHLQDLTRRRPELFAAWNDLGLAQDASGRFDEALASHRRALALDPGSVGARYNVAGGLQRLGRVAEAAENYRAALEASPGLAAGWVNLGLALFTLGDLAAATEAYERAIALEPHSAAALSGRGNVLYNLGQFDEAAALYQRAIDADPGAPDPRLNFGTALVKRGELAQAITQFSSYVALAPQSALGWCALASAQDHAADWDNLQVAERAVFHAVETGAPGIDPFVVLTLGSSPVQQRQAAALFVRDTCGAIHPTAPRAAALRPRIRIGYVSADFRNHATAYLATGLFEHHDRDQFETHAYSLSPDDRSPERARLEAAFDGFVDLTSHSHSDASARIRADGIDILVDLKGYTGSARPQIFAFRPAPLQVAYLGYPGTMAAGFIDYALVDAFTCGPAAAKEFTEALVNLPGSYQPNMHREIASDPGVRADHGLPAEGFVFCSFNQPYKITPAVFDVWMRLLLATPGSVLWLLEMNVLASAHLRVAAQARAVDPARLIFAPPLPSASHLARHAHADLFLDTAPVCAHTTASDALWAGLPLLACVGETFVSRVSGGLLSAIGMTDLITTSLADYEGRALRLAHDAEALAEVRARLAAARHSTSVFDASFAARRLEAAYAQMWRRHRDGGAPTGFTVAAA